MISSYGMQEMRDKFADIADGVHWTGDEVVVTKYGKTWVYLVSPDWFDHAQSAIAHLASKEKPA